MHDSPVPQDVLSTSDSGGSSLTPYLVLIQRHFAPITLGCTAFIVGGLHCLALCRVHTAAYGLEGAELLPHIQRLAAWDSLYGAPRAHGLVAAVFTSWNAVDGHYPPIIHLVCAIAQKALGLGRADLLLPQVLNWMALMGAGGVMYWQGSSAWPRALRWKPEQLRLRLALAGALLLTSPGLMFPVRRYYYDLPMTLALLILGCVMFCGRGILSPLRSLLAVLFTLLSLTIKWAAGLYLIPLWGVALLLGLHQVRRAHWLQALVPVLTVSLLGVAGGLLWRAAPESLVFQLGLVGTQPDAPPTLQLDTLERLRFYLLALWDNAQGPWTGVLLAALFVWRLREPQQVQRVIWTLLLTGSVVLYLVLAGPIPDGRYLMPILPWLLIGISLLIPLPSPQLSTGALAVLSLLQISNLDASVRSPMEPWQQWWWTSRAEDRPSQLESMGPLVEAILEQRVPATVRVEVARGTPSWEHLLAYALELRSPGRYSVEVHPEEGGLLPVSAGNLVRVRWHSPLEDSDPVESSWTAVQTPLGTCWVRGPRGPFTTPRKEIPQ